MLKISKAILKKKFSYMKSPSSKPRALLKTDSSLNTKFLKRETDEEWMNRDNKSVSWNDKLNLEV